MRYPAVRESAERTDFHVSRRNEAIEYFRQLRRQSGRVPAANLHWPFWIVQRAGVLRLTGDFPVHCDRVGAARRPARTVTQAFGVQLKFGDGAAQGVAVHTQLARSLALVALAFLQHRAEERRVGIECRSRLAPYH